MSEVLIIQTKAICTEREKYNRNLSSIWDRRLNEKIPVIIDLKKSTDYPDVKDSTRCLIADRCPLSYICTGVGEISNKKLVFNGPSWGTGSVRDESNSTLSFTPQVKTA